jgi:hypothetical protein
MKKTDLEKLKGKKLDIRRSRENALKRFGAAGGPTDRRQELAGGAGLMSRLLGQVIEKK